MSRKKTHEEYVKELAEKNPNVEVIGIYCGNRIKIPHRCKKCGNVWDASPTNILRGKSCPICFGTPKKTHEQYIKELYEINPNIEVLEEYNGSQTKILHRCIIHDYKWLVTPNNLLKGRGCPLCGKNIVREKLSRSHNDYINKLNDRNIEVIGEYTGSQISILHRCLIDGFEWEAQPNNILQGTGCPQCAQNLRNEKRTNTHEDYVAELSIKNPTIEVIDKYCGADKKITHHCLVHDVYWKIKPSGALQGNGCELCRKEKFRNNVMKTTQEYKLELSSISTNIIPEEEYIGANTSIKHKCLIHNTSFYATPSNILLGKTGCIACINEKRRMSMAMSNEEYKNKVRQVNPHIDVIDDYINIKAKILHRCNLHKIDWYATPEKILQGYGCPNCSEKSHGEKRISTWLENNNIPYESEKTFSDCRDKICLPFDFYIQKYNKIIEYDGIQHFKPIEYFGGEKAFKTQQKHDKIKDDFCKENGISLLRIPYYKYNNIEEELNNFIFI